MVFHGAPSRTTLTGGPWGDGFHATTLIGGPKGSGFNLQRAQQFQARMRQGGPAPSGFRGTQKRAPGGGAEKQLTAQQQALVEQSRKAVEKVSAKTMTKTKHKGNGW